MDILVLKKLITEDMASVTVNADGIQYDIQPIIDFSEEETKACGYELLTDEKSEEFKDFDSLVAKFNGCELQLVTISDLYSSLEEYEKEKALEHISMEELLGLVVPLADSFSLTCPYNERYDKKHPFGVYNISEELAIKAIQKLSQESELTAKRIYDGLSESDRADLPPFEELYDDIHRECLSYRNKHKKKAEKYGGEVFFCDEFSKGKTKYKEPEELWHFYESVDFLEACRYALDKMKENSCMRRLNCELDMPEYECLKNSYQSTEVTFCWHCTTSGQLAKVHYFKLNEQTVNWLKNLKNDYDLNYLEDLAFYRDKEVLFSSCTHEGYHVLSDKIIKR